MRKTTALDLTGKRFGHLTAVERRGSNKNGSAMWLCKCDCGSETLVKCGSLTSGATRSCGCHGEKYRPKEHKRLYNVWTTMNSRCRNPRHPSYKYYGACGVSVCDEWRRFGPFAEWMFSHGYNEQAERGEYTIDRIDSNGNYEPNNCRVISFKDQQRNKYSNVNTTLHGRLVCATELAEMLGVEFELVRVLVKCGYTADQIESIAEMRNQNGEN